MQREFVGQREPRPAFAGVRTLTLVALLGALSTQLGDRLGWWLPCIAFVGLVILVSISHYLRQAADPSLTTEVVKAAILWLLGKRAVAWPATPGFVAVTLGGIVALLAMR
jgi:uncharacterized membrane protein (DUF4010 family)